MMQLAEKEVRFIDFLEGLVTAKDRAALAALRRGLGKEPGEAPEMYPYVVRWAQGAPQWQEGAYYHVAALFAWHQGSWHGDASKHEVTNLGASFAQAVVKEPNTRQGVERRFVALLNCHPDDLPSHLRHAVGLLKSKEIAIDWAQLLQDIQGWGSERRRVQLGWARAFWGQGSAIGTGTPATSDSYPEEASSSPNEEEE